MLHRAYIFDLDGTLVDSLQDIHDALNAALALNQMPTATSDEVRKWVGEGLRTLCRRACRGADERIVERVVDSARRLYQDGCTRSTVHYPNILRMLNLLANRGAPMAVLSNKPHPLTLQVVDRLKLGDYFIAVHGSRDETDRKPDPAGALRTAALLGADGTDILVVGDSQIDIETARNAGMQIAAVTWGFRPAEELRKAGPDFLVHHPLEIPEIHKK